MHTQRLSSENKTQPNSCCNVYQSAYLLNDSDAAPNIATSSALAAN